MCHETNLVELMKHIIDVHQAYALMLCNSWPQYSKENLLILSGVPASECALYIVTGQGAATVTCSHAGGVHSTTHTAGIPTL